MNKFCPMPDCRVEAITPSGPDLLHVDARGIRPGGCCPDCGRASRAVHSYYCRHPADLPSLGRRVEATLRVRRFYCRNPRCARQTFAEKLPELVARRLGEAQGRAGMALGGEAGARLLRHLAMPASADTVLRLIRRLPPPVVPAPRVIAVDDWALRKGHTYGTIVVDLERRRVVDLLMDRSSTTVADWLRRHPEVAVVARDLAETRSVCGWLHRVCPRHRPGRAKGGSGGGSVARAVQRARHAGALAGPGLRAVAPSSAITRC